MDVFREFRFEAAHHLPRVGAGHKCHNVHGHSYRVVVTVAGDVDPDTGMVLDFGSIKDAFAPLLEQLDHHLLNDILDNPTAENLAVWIWDRLAVAGMSAVTVHETDHAGCTYRG